MNWTEIVGYLASLVVLLSFVMNDLRKLRMLNLLGCFLFVMYGCSIALFISHHSNERLYYRNKYISFIKGTKAINEIL